MEYLVVKGAIEDITNYADLYQNFSTVGSKSLEGIRRQYMDSELEKYNGTIGVSEDSVEVSRDYVAHGVMLDELVIVERAKISSTEERINDTVPKNYVEHGVMLDSEEKSAVVPTIVVEYVQHGVMLDEERVETKVEDQVLEEEEAPTSWDSDDDGSDESSWDNDEETAWGNNEEETSWGDEEEVEETLMDADEKETSWDEDEEVEESPWGEDDLEQASEETSWGGEEGESLNRGTEEDVIVKEPVQEDKPTEDFSRHSSFEPEPLEFKGNSSGSERDTSSFEQQKVLPRQRFIPKPEVKSPKPPSFDKEVKSLGNYPNVRAYVKGNPGCTSADVLKYFPSNELKKALMSSKVVEKKGKLYAV